MTLLNKYFCTSVSLAACFGLISAHVEEDDNLTKLHFPIKCTLDQDCFIQQFTDMDESEAHTDPFCGSTTYDGHKGTDIRLRTLKDIDKNIEVLAAANGTIKGIRKNMPDQLIISDNDRKAVKGIECGNGVVIDHANNIQTQYCHLKRGGSILNIGDKVKAGEKLGFIGVSGLTQFPHLHITVRKDGKIVDPFTGNMQSQGCSSNTEKNWWLDTSILMAKRSTILLDSNITGAPIKHNRMVMTPPMKATSDDMATIGWVWYTNLKVNDQVYINLKGPNGFEVETTSKPLNRNKASWSGFVGRKKKPQIGEYKITTYILRNNEKNSLEKLSSNVRIIEVNN